jgi:hypothetical protein
MASLAAWHRGNPRTNNGQMVKGLIAATGDQALDLILHE